jgi:hypothetical protein
MAIGKTVKVHVKIIGRYDEIVGEVILEDGRNLSHELVRAGLAWWDFMSSRDRSLWALEKHARKKQVGLWKNKYQIPPWEFQKGLAFLIDGKTSAEEVLLRLGVPSRYDKRGRTLTYGMGLGQNGELYVTSSQPARQPHVSTMSNPGRYNLILTFDTSEVLKKQHIVHARTGFSSATQ